ncbi:MAG: hypothetical protein ACYC0V_01560 [Armatimonadota bacterium]
MFKIPLNVFLLVMLMKYLLRERSPMKCAIFWAIGSTAFAVFLAFGGNTRFLLFLAPVRFGLALLYFWLLDRYEESFLYWVIFILGLPIVII